MRTFEQFDRGGVHYNTGSKNPRTNLTNAEVYEIRASKDSPAKLARDYDISVNAVHRILRRETWAHLTGDDD